MLCPSNDVFLHFGSQIHKELAESGDPGRIAATEVTLTVFDGRVVHEVGTN